jgi:hypothetical protein
MEREFTLRNSHAHEKSLKEPSERAKPVILESVTITPQNELNSGSANYTDPPCFQQEEPQSRSNE